MTQSSNESLSVRPDARRVAEAARKTFGTEDKARRWLLRPTDALSGTSPMALASTGVEGERKVLDLLARIDHGLAV